MSVSYLNIIFSLQHGSLSWNCLIHHSQKYVQFLHCHILSLVPRFINYLVPTFLLPASNLDTTNTLTFESLTILIALKFICAWIQISLSLYNTLASSPEQKLYSTACVNTFHSTCMNHRIVSGHSHWVPGLFYPCYCVCTCHLSLSFSHRSPRVDFSPPSSFFISLISKFFTIWLHCSSMLLIIGFIKSWSIIFIKCPCCLFVLIGTCSKWSMHLS